MWFFSSRRFFIELLQIATIIVLNMAPRSYRKTPLVHQMEVIKRIEEMRARNLNWNQISQELGIDRQKLQRWYKDKDAKLGYVSSNPDTTATVSSSIKCIPYLFS